MIIVNNRSHRGIGSTGGVGGFYESILALMVVTFGLLILTSSFAIINHHTKDAGQEDPVQTQAVLERLLADMDLFAEDHILRWSAAAHYNWTMAGMWNAGHDLEISLRFQDRTVTLYSSGNRSALGAAYLVSEPVSVYYNRGDVQVALLCVRVVP